MTIQSLLTDSFSFLSFTYCSILKSFEGAKPIRDSPVVSKPVHRELSSSLIIIMDERRQGAIKEVYDRYIGRFKD
ncbi:hypothetical protein PHYBLDRAFT_138334 [Phycomyces blakesleeanus NRRL 1555(-)]|uniref:Uncharacterized protein n=1 Tax=Phycomyces blakesleeanus (strain ATCC 8743b / DSM 1359 / FGSC 10004 / NBRC 33097 / NRRL 1555) TaxID=763407 RepID=A0A167R3T3_PHYB8|nr:hypothetical protein PHYBLDRAFT_138334 [Phycomyces blakesleeanus NRRL 1555(-)]OAD80784.1 hypothetical protein PHYBLDRAFT_138334 [Phycomyces blakesleeanus NRRL 1555(-)]|eukprot:XP_018298824.1 hypothetical protein PHYBLDRAFT_138334 [Phycomyces blakesleeanus NRRL 1555(-)]